MDNTNQDVPKKNNQPEVKSQQVNSDWLRTLSIGIGVVGIGLVIGIGGYFLGTKKSQPQAQKVVAQVSPTPTPDPTANWKTYANSKFGYQFKYPADHTVYSDVDQKKPTLVPAISTSAEVAVAANESMVFCCEPSTLSFSIEVNNKNARSRAEEYLDVSDWAIEKPSIKDGILDGLPTVEASGRGGYGPPHKLIIVSRASFLLIIVQNNNDPLLDQILSTFKFTP